jgi:hypothetical protein
LNEPWSSRAMPLTVTRLCVLLLALCPSAPALLAADPVPVPARAAVESGEGQDQDRLREKLLEQVLKMREFFDTILPGTLGEHNLALKFSPRFGDLRHREFIRYRFEVRYGATDRLELMAGMTPFSPNPINSGEDHRWGPGEARLGARYDLRRSLPFFDRTTVGIENRIPLGKPPVELNDHYTHVRPWIALSRTLRSFPDTTFYTNLSYDRSVKLVPRGPPPPEVIRRHISEVAPGVLYKPGELGYLVEYRFRHFEEVNNPHFGHEVLVGTIWDVPLYRSIKWRLPGKWQVELGYRVSFEEGRDTDHGVSARVNWRTSLREVLAHLDRSNK